MGGSRKGKGSDNHPHTHQDAHEFRQYFRNAVCEAEEVPPFQPRLLPKICQNQENGCGVVWRQCLQPFNKDEVHENPQGNDVKPALLDGLKKRGKFLPRESSKPHLRRIEIGLGEEGDPIEKYRQCCSDADLCIGDPYEICHNKGGDAHDRGREHTPFGSTGLDGTRIISWVAQAFHGGYSHGPCGHHIGDGTT